MSPQDTNRMMGAATRYSHCYTQRVMATVGEKQASVESSVSEAIAKVTEFSSKMCACRDKACADGVNAEYTQWGRAMSTAKPTIYTT